MCLGQQLEQFGRQMGAGAAARRREAHLARIGARVGDQLLGVLERRIQRHRRDQRRHAHQRDANDVLGGVVRQLVVQRGVAGKRGNHHAKGQTVGRGLGKLVYANDAVGAGLVLDDDGLAQRLLQADLQHACHLVGEAAGRVGNDDAYRLGGPGRLGPGRCRGSGRARGGGMNKLTA